MNAPKCQPEDYINYLVASPRVVSGTEAARVQPDQANPPAHDAFTRLLHRLEPDPATLWAEAAPQVRRGQGVLVLDDSTLDKPYARQIGLLTRHWSGKHRRVVQGINLLTLLWTDGEALIPCDYRLYEKAVDQLSKNDHFRAMLATALERGFTPDCVVFDSWYASLANLKAIRGHGWRWVTQLKANRLVNPDGSGNRPLGECAITEAGTRVHLQGYGFVLVFLIVLPDGDREYWATNDLTMGALTRRKYAEFAWGIEVYHRGLKQHCGAERAEVRAARAQRNHINCAIRAFLRLEQHRLVTGVSWWEAKTAIIREAIRLYLAHPRYTLVSTAEATA
jgi:putative transposase